MAKRKRGGIGGTLSGLMALIICGGALFLLNPNKDGHLRSYWKSAVEGGKEITSRTLGIRIDFTAKEPPLGMTGMYLYQNFYLFSRLESKVTEKPVTLGLLGVVFVLD